MKTAETIDLPGYLQRRFDEANAEYPIEEEMGHWPKPGEMTVPPLSAARDGLTGQPFETVYIVILPTDDPAESLAYLGWGGWHECPDDATHVAVLRRWQKLYGAVLVGISGAVLDFKVTNGPKNREDALALAREQFYYCPDIVWQKTGGLAPLAQSLIDSDWWYFWWD